MKRKYEVENGDEKKETDWNKETKIIGKNFKIITEETEYAICS
jgi:hypothetical protein